MKRLMKRLIAGLSILCATVLLSGCYVSPDYSYVRGNGYTGGAYYGSGPSVIYDNSYYASPYYGGYGCCWAPGVTVGGVWYSGRYYRGGHRYYRGGYRGYPRHGHGYHGGHGRPAPSHGHGGRHWNGGHGGGHHHHDGR
jgi:hypothetical protein